jgi:hypothetical protein
MGLMEGAVSKIEVSVISKQKQSPQNRAAGAYLFVLSQRTARPSKWGGWGFLLGSLSAGAWPQKFLFKIKICLLKNGPRGVGVRVLASVPFLGLY